MSRVFAYCRVSTVDQTTENQVREIAGAGFAVAPSFGHTASLHGSCDWLPALASSLQREGHEKRASK
jgi:hypothetical protein